MHLIKKRVNTAWIFIFCTLYYFLKKHEFFSNKVSKLLKDIKLLKIPNTSKSCTVPQNILYFYHVESKDYVGYVICKTCKQRLKHKKLISRAMHLNDHLKRCRYNGKISPEVTSYFSKSDISLSNTIKDIALNSSVAFVVQM